MRVKIPIRGFGSGEDFLYLCRQSPTFVDSMEVHLYPQCEEGRESGAELSATVPVGECPKSTGLGEAGIYENALGDALRQCKLQKDFDMAMARWGMLRRMARKMGAPAELVEHYEDMLVEYFEQKNDSKIQTIGDIIMDNHGTLNKN